MAVSYARASRIASSCPKDFNFASFMYANEGLPRQFVTKETNATYNVLSVGAPVLDGPTAQYPMWVNPNRLFDFIKSRPGSVPWNVLVAALSLITFVFVSMDFVSTQNVFGLPLTSALDLAYNMIYAVHVIAIMYKDENASTSNWYLIDLFSYAHYLTPHLPQALHRVVNDLPYRIQITCYHFRLHRPFRFLWGLNDYYLKGSIAGTFLKYWYIFTILHVICANLYLWMGIVDETQYYGLPEWLHNNRTRFFYRSIYVLYKRFIPIGMDIPPKPGDEMDRVFQLLALITGSLMVTGLSIASLSLAIGLHMRAEEMFRARVRLIISDMKATHVPFTLLEKVETFYKMYWHKQKAVSVTQLLPTYPPTLAHTICTDIYFEAQQKSVLLCDLSYQFLSEIAQHMKTINYIPGDIIIKRNSQKYAMMYISYGDVELMTAEDDETPVLRFTRGSIMNPCAGSAVVASSNAHVCIRAATFCTAHVLKAVDIWRVTARYGRFNGQSFIWHSSFKEHFDKVLRHYAGRPRPAEPVKHKSTVLVLKRNLIELKQARDENGVLILGRQDMFLELARCYVMRNQSDAALTEDSDSICLRPTFPCILQPASSLIILWKVFIVIMTITVTFVHPYNLVYIKTPHIDFKFFDFLMTIVYAVDILIHLSTGAKIEEGVPVTFLQTSSQQVWSGWFLLDVVSVLPIFAFIGDGRFAGINKVFKLPKVFLILKEMEDVSLYQSDVFRFLAYCLLVVMLNWLVATAQQAYMCFGHGYCNVKTITTPPHWEKGPLKESENDDTTRLLYSIYWALSFSTFTSHKTGELTMHLWHMQFFIMILLEACGKFHQILEAAYSATIMVKGAMRDQYKTCIENVKTFLVKNDVDAVLCHRFINYLQLCWYTDMAYSITHGKTSIHFDLPQHVYQDISGLQRNKYIVCVPFMKYLRPEVVKKLCAEARLFYTSPNEILLNTGDICNEIYIIRMGFCEVVDPVTKKVVVIMSSKDHFGDVECLMRLPAYYTVRAVTHVQIFSISRKDLGQAITTPKIKDAIIHTKIQPEYIKMMHNRQAPFLKYEMPIPATSRRIFPILRKHEADTAFLQPFKSLGFFSSARYIFPRFTLRPDGMYLRRYEWYRALCAFLSAIVFPVYYLLVLQLPWLKYLSFFLDICAYLDVFQRLLVAYYNENGILVYHPVSTAAHYIKGAMITDLLGCLPFEYCDDLRQKMYTNDKYQWTPSTMQYLMCNRIIQLYRFPAALEVLDEYIDRQDIIFVIKAIPILMVVINTLTSVLVQMSVNIYGITGGGWAIIPLEVDFKPWINENGNAVGYNITASPFNVLLTVYYWVTSEITTTGLDCFQPDCHAQLVVLIVGMFIGSIMIPYFAVRVLSIRSNVNQALAGFQENMKDLVAFMKRENFYKALEEEALQFYEYTWERTGGSDYRSIFKLCDQITLRTDAILHIYGQTFHKCPILYHCDPSLQRLMGRAVHSVYFREGMTVIERDDIIKELYFVDYGTMEARDSEDDDLIAAKLPRGSIFGNLGRQPMEVCINKFVASTNLHLLLIDTWLFYKILQDFPANRGRMIKYRPNDENYVIGSVRAQSVAKATYERSMSTAIIVVTRQGILKHLHTHAKVIQIVLIIASIICVYLDLYNAAFQDNGPKVLLFLYMTDVVCICKIAINYYVPQVTDEQSESRKALLRAKQRYYRGEFKYDILSVLPIELFCLLFDDPWSAFAYLRLNRFLRVTTINSNLSLYHSRLSINLTASTIVASAIWFTLFVHTSTCMWYMLGVIHDKIEAKSSWRWGKDKHYMCSNDYICSMYFVMTTFSQNGVGDILPRQQAEVIYVILLMILSTMMYMIYVGEFSNIMQYQFFRCFSFYKEFMQLKEFLKYNRVSHNLVTLTDRYTLHLWRTSRGLQVPLFLKDAPPCLRHKLMAAAYMLHLKKHPSFKRCERAFLRHLVAHFRPFTYHENMYVVREGEITNAMYFVHHGSVQEVLEDFDEKTQVFETGMFFGTSQGLTRETPFTHSYKTLTKSQVLTLSMDDWEYLLHHFPDNKETIYKPHKGLGDIKEKKRVCITKAAKVHRISKFDDRDKKLSTPAPSPIYPPNAAGSAGTFTGIPSGRLSDDIPTMKSDVRLASKSIIRFGISSKPESEGVGVKESSQDITSDAAATDRSAESKQMYIQRRKSTTLNIDREAVERELKRLGSEENESDDEPQMKESAPSPLPVPQPQSPWPLDNRRDLETEPSEKTDDLSKPQSSRRKSVVQGIDRKAVEQELKELSSVQDVVQDIPKTNYNRRKSTIYGINKAETDRELEMIGAITSPPINEVSSAEETELRAISYGTQEGRSSEKPVTSEKSKLFYVPGQSLDSTVRGRKRYDSKKSIIATSKEAPLQENIPAVSPPTTPVVEKIKGAMSKDDNEAKNKRGHVQIGSIMEKQPSTIIQTPDKAQATALTELDMEMLKEESLASLTSLGMQFPDSSKKPPKNSGSS